MDNSLDVKINSFLLLTVISTMLITTISKSEIIWVVFLSLIASSLLIIKLILIKYCSLPKLTLLISMTFVLHYILTPEKFSTFSLMISTLYLYQAVSCAQFNYKIIIYPIILVFLTGLFVTLPEMLNSFQIQHTSRADLYTGIFQNSNTNAAFCLVVFMSVVLFFRKTRKKNILLCLIIFSIISTGSRNAILSLILFICFCYIHKTKFAKYSFLFFLLFLIFLFLYMVLFESKQNIDFNFMGKETNSAGRSEQILFVMNSFPLRLFGNGKDVIDNTLSYWTDFSIHNFYINSLYSFGILPLLGYFYFIYTLWKNQISVLGKSFLLVFNIYFFFEPGTCFYLVFLNVVPILIVQLHNKEYKIITKGS